MTCALEVVTPSRLHFGLLNLSSYGRRVDGGVGLMIDSPDCIITAGQHSKFQVDPPELRDEVQFCTTRLGVPYPQISFKVRTPSHPHEGLGWRTQLRLGIATATCLELGIPIKPSELAPIVGRGGTSGIGSLGFWHGGLIIDGGHLRSQKLLLEPSSAISQPRLPPMLFSEPFPWSMVVGVVADMKHVNGSQEAELFRRYTPVPEDETLDAIRIVHTELAPAVKEYDFEAFCDSISMLREIGFKRRELEYRGTRGREAVKRIEAAGADGVTMSSWGPAFTGFFPSRIDAEKAVATLCQDNFFSRVWATNASRGGAMVNHHGKRVRALNLATEGS